MPLFLTILIFCEALCDSALSRLSAQLFFCWHEEEAPNLPLASKTQLTESFSSFLFYLYKSYLKSRYHLFIFCISCTATKFLLSGPSPWHLIQWECDQRPSENVISPQYGVHPLWQHINQLNINHTVLETAQLTPGNLWAPGKIGHPPTCGGVVARGCWLLLVEISLEEDAAPKVSSRRLLPLPIVCMENADLSAHTQIILTNWKPKP